MSVRRELLWHATHCLHLTSASASAPCEQYVRVGCGGKLTGAEKTRVALQMRRLLLAEWRARRPNIVITVTGGAKAFTCSKLLKKRFKHGLIRAAQNTGTSEMGNVHL